MGATATSLLLSVVGALPLAGVHLLALVRVAPLASTRACCWAPFPMAPLPMVVRDDIGGEGEKWGCPLSSGSGRFLQRRVGSVVAVVPSACCVGCGSDAIADGECVPDSSAHLKRFVHGHLNPGLVSLATLGGKSRRAEECVERWEELARGLRGLAA